jgi:hypothetical protein
MYAVKLKNGSPCIVRGERLYAPLKENGKNVEIYWV